LRKCKKGIEKKKEKWKKENDRGPKDTIIKSWEKFDIVSRIWTYQCNIFKWINAALFLDFLNLVFGGKTPNFFKYSFPAREVNYYEKILEH
jgi:hypothetical protein